MCLPMSGSGVDGTLSVHAGVELFPVAADGARDAAPVAAEDAEEAGHESHAFVSMNRSQSAGVVKRTPSPSTMPGFARPTVE